MKKNHFSELIWGTGSYLLFTLVLVLFLALLNYFSWQISALIAGGGLTIGICIFIYITWKYPKEEDDTE